jgi:hypothetical protein
MGERNRSLAVATLDRLGDEEFKIEFSRYLKLLLIYRFHYSYVSSDLEVEMGFGAVKVRV